MAATRHLSLPHEPVSATVARHLLADELARDGLPSDVVDDAMLVVTELVGNAVIHGRPRRNGDVDVAWEIDDDNVRIVVHDGGGASTPHVPRTRGANALTGRGLSIVAAVASGWGVQREPEGAAVWAVVGKHSPVPH